MNRVCVKEVIDHSIYNIKLQIERKHFINKFHQLLTQLQKIKDYLENYIENSKIPLTSAVSPWKMNNAILLFIYDVSYHNNNKKFPMIDDIFRIGRYSIAYDMLTLAHKWTFHKFMLILQVPYEEINFSLKENETAHNTFFNYLPVISLMMDARSAMLYYKYAVTLCEVPQLHRSYTSDKFYIKIIKNINKLNLIEKKTYAYEKKIAYFLFNNIIYNKLSSLIEKFYNKINHRSLSLSFIFP